MRDRRTDRPTDGVKPIYPYNFIVQEGIMMNQFTEAWIHHPETNHYLNTLRSRQNGRHIPDDIFKCIFFFENVYISLKISIKFVPEVRINDIPALVQIMAWRRPGDKPLSEPMMVRLLTHICVTRPQRVNQQRHSLLMHICTSKHECFYSLINLSYV